MDAAAKRFAAETINGMGAGNDALCAKWSRTMRMSPKILGSCAVGLLIAFGATEASAQMGNISGRYICIENCRGAPGGFGYVTQSGRDLTFADQSGNSSRAWMDWSNPNKIWVDGWDQNAFISPSGMTLQFDRGMVWQRAVEMPPPPVRRKVVRPKKVTVTTR